MNQLFLRPRETRGFTLIELLIVIAIILILIAIALPNFLEAQIRARVTKAKGEIRTLGIAMESYRLDWKIYPGRSLPYYQKVGLTRDQVGFTWLTTPIAYITSLPDDPFARTIDIDTGEELAHGPFSYNLMGVDNFPDEFLTHPHGGGLLVQYTIVSAGPDQPNVEEGQHGCYACPRNGLGTLGAYCGAVYSYSPTNGTKSKGDIWLWGGESAWIGLAIDGRCVGVRRQLNDLKGQAGGIEIDGTFLRGRFPQGGTL